MTVFRVCKEDFARDLSGEGARRAGGRWNSPGTPMVYATGTRALCLLELLVHRPTSVFPSNYVLVELSLPDTLPVRTLARNRLPAEWRAFPHPKATRLIGDKFSSEEKYVVMKVPSAIVPEEWNVLINPIHPRAASISIVRVDPLVLDPRFLRS